jgi:plastocyanin domain-containing protein
MTITQIIVNLVGLALIALIVWYFWLYRREGTKVAEAGGIQEDQIKVRVATIPT